MRLLRGSADDATVSAGALLQAWGIDGDAADLPVMALPFPLAYLVAVGKWSSLVVLARWHKHCTFLKSPCPGPFPDWPPSSATIWAHVGEASRRDGDECEAQRMSHTFLSWALQQLRSWSVTILRSSPQGDIEKHALERFASTLDSWHHSMLACAGLAPPLHAGKRFIHDSRKLVECIRMCAGLRGGADNLTEVVSRGLALAAPPFIAGPLIAALQTAASSSKMPKPSLLRRYHLALDIALMLFVRRRASKVNGRVYRFAHADSSPIAGFDWLWTQHTEIAEVAAPAAFQAICKLAAETKSYRADADAYADDGEALADDAHDAGQWIIDGMVENPPHIWDAWHKTICKSFFEVINPPSALGAGHRGVANKASHLMFATALHTPASTPLSTECDSFHAICTDMGIELSIADFLCKDPQELLPPWVGRTFAYDLEDSETQK